MIVTRCGHRWVSCNMVCNIDSRNHQALAATARKHDSQGAAAKLFPSSYVLNLDGRPVAEANREVRTRSEVRDLTDFALDVARNAHLRGTVQVLIFFTFFAVLLVRFALCKQ